MSDVESQKQIKAYCLTLLARREYSQKELLDKAATKAFDCHQVQFVIDDLAEQGWQSDRRFAESYARYRIKKGVGPIKIRYELHQRGISEFDLDQVMFDLFDSWQDLLEQVYKKKYSDDGPLSAKEWLRRSRFLQQRGFLAEMIQTFYQHTIK